MTTQKKHHGKKMGITRPRPDGGVKNKCDKFTVGAASSAVSGSSYGTLTTNGCATSYPGSSLFLPRESTLVLAGHVAPKIWVLTRMCFRGGGGKCKIVTSVRMVDSTGGDVSFFRNICRHKNAFYRQVFLHYIRTFDIEAVHVIFDSEKHVYKSEFQNTVVNHRHNQRKPARVTT